MSIIKLQNLNLVIDTPQTILTADTAAGVTALTVKNITGFAVNQVLIIGQIGNQGSEIVKTHASSAPSGSTITLASATVFPHSSSTSLQLIQYDQVEFSNASTITGSKSVLATINLWADNASTNYIDNSGSTGYYFGRFKNTIASSFSSYSDPIPVSGYGLLATRTIIDSALGAINKSTSEVLSDAYAFIELNNCQTEVLKTLKRWSFMQKFDAIIGQVSTGSWKVAMPTDLDDQNTNKSVYQLRIGTQQRLVWVDKEKFDEFFVGVGYSTLAVALNSGDSTMTLTNSGDLNATTGTVTIGANSYNYTANNTTTGVLTLSTTITSSNAATINSDVFQGATQGLPNYWTTYGGFIYYTPNTASTYNGNNLYMDYYIQQTPITTDSTSIILPDSMVAINYLCWKFLKKLNNGLESDASASYRDEFKSRLLIMKNKEVMNRTFKLKPRIQNFNIQSEFSEDTPRWIRDAGFQNTGF